MNTLLPSTLEMMQELIAIPSMSSFDARFDTGNGPLCARLAAYLEDAGCEVRLLPVPGCAGKVNLLAQFGSGPPGIALCGHTDTVPYDEERWSLDPFTAGCRDGRLYGLGSSDMKGFLAICAAVLASMDSSTLRRSVVVIGSADEESSMAGARALAEAGEPIAPYAVIGEPTGLAPVRLHKGILMESVKLVGRAGHSSNPALGANAIDAMHDVIGALRAWRRELRQRHSDERFDVPSPTLNFGALHGGDNPNRICGECELYVDLRVTPGMTTAAAREELRDTVRHALTGSAVTAEFAALFAGVDPLATAADSRVVRACEAHSGCAAGGVNFATEAPFFTALGAETVVFGPGSIDLAHQPDEYLDLRFVAPAEKAVRALVEQFCVD